MIVHELIKVIFEDSMRETILPYIKASPFIENFEGMSPYHAIFPQAHKILACICVVILSENLEYFYQITS